MDSVKVKDAEICYQVMGKGDPLVMIMGLTANMNWWEPDLVNSLSKDYRLLIFDNRGAGRTVAPAGEFTIKQFAEDTAGLMESVGMEHAHVVGLSMGGMIAQELVLNYPEKVDRLVLCATYCGGKETVYADREVLKKLLDLSGTLEDKFNRTLSMMFPPDWLASNEGACKLFFDRYRELPTTEESAASQFMATVRFDACERLSQIDKPTMVACGSADVLIPPENSRIIAGRIPGAQLVEFDGAGHGFMYERREEFEKQLRDFLG